MEYANKRYYVYAIYHLGDIIYIGSTYDMEKRSINHNSNLRKSYKVSFEYVDNSLYRYCCKNNICDIQIVEIQSGYDDICIVGKGKHEYRRFIEEEKYINHCLKKGIKITNVSFPTFYDKDGLERTISNNNFYI
jgi:hypothetical protein